MQSRSPGLRLRRVALFVFTPILLLLILIPVLALTLDIGGMVRKQVLAMKPDWEQQLGRPIAIGAVSLRLLPSVAAEIHDVAIAAAPDARTGTAPLLTLGAVKLGIAVWPLFAGQARISDIEVVDLTANIVRGADGRLSYEDIIERQAQQAAKPSAPLTQEQLDYVKRLALGHIEIKDAALRFQDQSVTPASNVAISHLDLRMDDVALGKPLLVHLSAAVLAEAPNLDVSVKLGPLPAELTPDLKIDQPLSLVQKIQVRMQPLQLEPLLRFAPPADLMARAALFDCDLDLETPAAAGQLQLKGEIGLRGLTLTHAAARGRHGATAETVGAPTDLRLRTDLRFAFVAGDLDVKELTLTVNDMSVHGNADARTLFTSPRVQALSLTSQGLVLERLLALLPAGALPPGTTLRGPLLISASGSGDAAHANLEATVDLTGATVQVPALRKPPGTALSLSFRGALAEAGVRIDRLGLVLGPLSLLVSGTAKPGGDADLKLDSGSVELDKLLRLLPQVEHGVPAGTKLAGALQITGAVQKKGGHVNAQAHLGLSGADLETPELALSGAAQLSVTAQTAPGSANIDASVDLSGARLLVPGTVDKARGVPMELKLVATTAGETTTVRTANLKLPGGDITATGSLTQTGKTGSMNLQIPNFALDFAKLSQSLPVLRHGVPPAIAEGQVKLNLSVTGDPGNLATARAKLANFELRAAGGVLSGDAEVVGLSEPKQITFHFSGQGMDLSKFSSDDKAAASPAPAHEAAGAPKIPPFMKKLVMDGSFKMVNVRYHTSPIKELALEVTMRDGKLVLKTLRGAAFSGSLDASGSTVDFTPATPRFDLKADLNKVEISDVLALRGDSEAKISGKGDVNLVAKGAGLRYEDIAPAVTGTLVLGLNQGKLHTASLVGQVVNPILDKVQGRIGKQKVNPEMALRDLNAKFKIEGGKLGTTAPIALSTDEGTLRLSGNIGLDQRLEMTGDFQIAAQAISLASGGKIVPSGPLPVTLRIGGTLKAPQIELLDLGKTVAALAGMLLKGKIAQGLLNEIPGGVGKQLGGVLGGAGAPGGAPPSAAAAEAQAKQKAQQEEQRLKDEAKKKLGGLGGLLGN